MGAYTEALKAVATLDNNQWNSAVDKMSSKSTAFKRAVAVGFKQAGAAVTQLGHAAVTASKYIAVGAAAAAGAITLMVKKTLDQGDAMDKMSARMGLATEFLSKLKYAANQSGTSMEEFETAIRKMQSTAFDASNGMKSAQVAFDKLGVSVYDGQGKLRKTEELFMTVADRLSKVQNSAQKAALAQDLFGRSGTMLLPMLEGGRKGLNDLMNEGSKFAFVWTSETSKAAAKVNDSFGTLWSIVNKLSNTFAMQLIPKIGDITSRAIAWYDANRKLVDSRVEEWGRQLGSALEWVANSMQTIITSGFDGWLSKQSRTLQDWADNLKTVGSVLGWVSGYKVAELFSESDWMKHMQGLDTGRVDFSADVAADRRKRMLSGGGTAGIPSGPPAFQRAPVPQPSALTVNVAVNNSLVGSVDSEQAQVMGEAIAREIQRGHVAAIFPRER